MTHIPTDNELDAYADPGLEQYFLVSGDKLSKLIDAAGIRPTDHVVELGAGAGTVARVIPLCESLTAVELDTRLRDLIRQSVPHARVLQGDALELVKSLKFDVLIGNLPTTVTESLLGLMPQLSFRTAVLAVAESTDLAAISPTFTWTEVTTITGDDFRPPQPSVSRIIKISPAGP